MVKIYDFYIVCERPMFHYFSSLFCFSEPCLQSPHPHPLSSPLVQPQKFSGALQTPRRRRIALDTHSGWKKNQRINFGHDQSVLKMYNSLLKKPYFGILKQAIKDQGFGDWCPKKLDDGFIYRRILTNYSNLFFWC